MSIIIKNMISQERLKEIINIIKDKKLHEKSLNQIARENNIEVIFADLSTISDFPLSWSIWNFNGKFKIYLEEKNSVKRQKFTYAHELGHFFLHKNLLVDNNIIEDKKEEKYLFRNDIYDNVSAEMKQIEEEANEFAGILLMPEETVRKIVDVVWMSIPVMADYFEVSEKAMKYRLYKLWIIREYGN